MPPTSAPNATAAGPITLRPAAMNHNFLRAVVQIRRNRNVLCRTSIRPSDTAEQKMRKVQALHTAMIPRSRRIINQYVLCRSTMIGTVQIMKLDPNFIDAQLAPVEVFISDKRRDDSLTVAYQRHDLLEHAASCFEHKRGNVFYFVGSELNRLRVGAYVPGAAILSRRTMLEREIIQDSYPEESTFATIAGRIDLGVDVIKNWFRNNRSSQ
ncbi:hypothetical protein GTA08_BOTSDO06154 [Botryosphaeria dothidea]|uniref:Homeobox domain-containing protein n=1 Tax=Botryosphaeria dothidea TaxID=55169 RepID=A0A8H4N4D0_9PEZI|nr:hypothetical protein GTA08_BOTSDO06154 [Botryosphaeria dothidea]